jgi:hypothetical protein
LEHATVANFERIGIWLVAVTISGKRVTVRQPFVEESARARLLALAILAVFSQLGRILAR